MIIKTEGTDMFVTEDITYSNLLALRGACGELLYYICNEDLLFFRLLVEELEIRSGRAQHSNKKADKR